MDFRGLLSVVIPVYRSQEYLERTVKDLIAVLEPQCAFEIILVNDGSPDAVQAVIERLHAADPRVGFVELGSNQGQHSATLRGFAACRGDVVITLDDDGQNPAAAGLTVADELWKQNLDVVYGRFQSVAQGASRRAASRINRWFSQVTLGNKSGISITNVRAIRGELARVLGAAQPSYPYIDSMIFRATRRIGEVQVEHLPRSDGSSTYGLAKLVRLWLSHMTTLSVAPLNFATAGSFGAAALGFIVGAAQLIRVLVERRAPEGWLSLFCATTFLFGLLFLFLGVLGTYIGRLYVAHNSAGLSWVRTVGEGRAKVSEPRVAPRANSGSS